MADFHLSPRSALASILHPGRHGVKEGAAGVILSEVTGFALANVTVFQGQLTALKAAIKSRYDVDLPSGSKRVSQGDISFIGIGPGQWLALAKGGAAPGFFADLVATIGVSAAVVDQSDARALIRITGSHVRDALEKGVSIDLHPRVFTVNDAAATFAAHLWITLWQTDETPCFEISVFRAFGGSLLDWLTSISEEFGLDIV